MRDIKILHTGDWHADSDPIKMNKLEVSLIQMVDYCKENKVNAIVHTGDIWEKKQSYSTKSGVPLVVEYLRKLSKLVDFIFITKGNNSHDEVGSVSLLHQLEPNIHAYEYPVSLAVALDEYRKPYLVDLIREPLPVDYDVVNDITEYIVSLVPYPTKANFVTNDSIDNNNSDFIEKFEQIFELIGDVTSEFVCPKILGFHGNVVGSLLSSGQTLVSQDIMVAPRTLELAKHNYYALGHIHLRQEIKNKMVYAGSIYNKSWGEIEQKSFEVIEFIDSDIDEVGMIQKTIMLTSSRPMIKIDAEFDGEFHFDMSRVDFSNMPEVRFRTTVKENDRKLLTDEKISEVKKVFGEDVKIEFNVIPDERTSRSENIMVCKSLLEEVQEYAKTINFKLTESIQSKVIKIREEECKELV